MLKATSTFPLMGDSSNSGGSIVEYTPAAMQITFASGIAHPRGLAFDRSGNLFAGLTFGTPFPGNTTHGEIVKFPPFGHQSVLGNAALSILQGVVTDDAGNVFAVANAIKSQSLAATIYKFAPDGTRSIFSSTPSQTFGLAFDSAGSLFAADAIDQTIYKFTPSGTRTVFAGPSAFLPDQAPAGLAFDGIGPASDS
jgi:hypothetical protein